MYGNGECRCFLLTKDEGMRKSFIIVPLIAGAVGVLGIAGTASAATTATTTLTFTEAAGAISITAPTSATLLPPLVHTGVDQVVSAAIGTVTVTDHQGNNAGWTASASATDFSDGNGHTIPIADASYTPPAATVTGTATVNPTTLPALSTTATAVQTATTVAGDNTATWNPTISLTVPAAAVPGTYTSTLTQSVI